MVHVYSHFQLTYGTIMGKICLQSCKSILQVLYQDPIIGNQENGSKDSPRWTRDTLYTQKLALTSPASGGRSVGIVMLQNQDTEF
jgi:hypothetical protein